MLFNKSFHILRANPKLTTNAKLVVTSDQKLYLESYKTSKELSDDRFRHYEVKDSEYLFDVLPRFWEGVQSDLAYGPRNQKDYDVVYDDFKYQYDDLYYTGASFAEDTWYNEEYEFTAPLWIKKDFLPVGFMILRVDGPGLSDGNSPYNFRSEILDKWKLVSLVDMTNENKLGKFLEKQLNYSLFPESPTEINHEELRFSTFNGIDYAKSGYVQKSIDFDPIKSLNTRIFDTEEDLTNMWQNLGIIFPNILNLKFLFDDTPATSTTLRTWSINRYIGFYIDSIEQVKKVSPYKPFNLKKTPNEVLESLLPQQVAELPYVLDNAFVRDVNNRRYTFDPIEGDWKDGQQYWIEWNGQYYRLSKEANTNSGIIGAYSYKIIADVNIKYSAPSDVTNVELIRQYEKVLLNEISTLKYQVQIIDNLVFENISAQNIIQNVNSTYTTLDRQFEQYLVNGQLVWGFRIALSAELNNNLFSIDNFSEADLHYITINGKKHLIKQYASNIPNIGGLYYLQSDYAIRVNSRSTEQWINNGITSKDPLYYSFQDIESVATDATPIFYTIQRVSFSDIKDFDFNRMDTEFSHYEYEKKDQLHQTLEPKLYAKERRNLGATMLRPQELNAQNFTNDLFKSYLLCNPESYQQFLNQYTQPIQRSPVSPEVSPVRVYFDKFEDYVNFKYGCIVTNVPYYVNNVQYSENLKTYKAKLPLYVFPKRIPVLDINNNPASDPSTGLPIYQTDFNGNYIYTPESILQKTPLANTREYYREEGYILLQSDVDPVKTIDFKTTTEPSTVQPVLTWDPNMPMASSMVWSPFKKGIEDPNVQYDPNYLPVTSEYIASEELYEIRNRIELSPIWDKNQWVCKWGFMNSIDTHDYAYRLNYDLEVGGLFNQSSNAFNDLNFAVRRFRDLDYFYRFGIDNTLEGLDYYTLHVKEPFFDIDKHLTGSFDYFDWVFHSDLLTNEGIKVFKKYGVMDFGDINEGSYCLFKGIKYRLYDVSRIIFDQEFLADGQQFVEDFETINSTKYNGYKFTIALGKRLSSFQYLAGDNDGDFGIDIILNEKYKNIVILLYFETDSTITFGQTLDNGDIVQLNLETSQIDLLYEADQIDNQAIDPTMWDNGQIKINGTQNVGDVRIRDFKLFNFLATLNEKNYDPVNGTGRKPVRYVRISETGSIKIMTNVDTDFCIEAELPTGFLMKERTYVTNVTHPINLDVNNSIRNTIILDDDPNATNGSNTTTSTGALVSSILDVNAWDGMAVGRTFTPNDPNDTRPFYDHNPQMDPLVYRHNGCYAPIFLDANLFRPSSYWTKTSSSTMLQAPVLSAKNWKFYDDFSDNLANGPSNFGWGFLKEMIFSKVNRSGNILKLAQDGDNKTRSIYPMVDEYGYDFSPRYLFQSTWDRNFYLESRQIQLSRNEYPGLSGYTIFLDGYSDRLKINDNIKFNLVPSGYSNNTVINPGDNLDLPNTVQSEISITNINPLKETRFYLIDTTTGQRSSVYYFIPNNGLPGITNIAIDSYISNFVFAPNTIVPTSIKVQSAKFLKYETVFFENDPTNFNGHTYLLNKEASASLTVFAKTQMIVQPINGQIMFNMVTNTRGTIQYAYFIPSNVSREKFLKEFSISKFISDSNAFLQPDYSASNPVGDINNLSFTITANVVGPAYNFTIQPIMNAVENLVYKTVAPVESDFVEKSTVGQLQYVGQNSNLTQFTNKAIRSMTIECWLKVDGFRKEYETILYKGSDDVTNPNVTNDWTFILRRNKDTDNIEFVTHHYDIDDSQDLTTIIPYNVVAQTGTPVFEHALQVDRNVNDGTFHHIACVFDAENKKKYVYIDGVREAQYENENFNNLIIDSDPNLEDKNWPLIIGSDYQNGVLNFRGSIDELRIWNYARSAEQILSNYNLRVNPYSYLDPARTLVAYYQFDEQQGVLEIQDHSQAIFGLERLDIKTQNITTNGVQQIVEETQSYKQNETTEHTLSPIRITDVTIEWIVSQADIKGTSDERYTAPLPVPSTQKKVSDLPVEIIPRSKYAGVFEPSVTPVPRPVPPEPPNPVKVVDVPQSLKKIKKPLKLLRFKPKNSILKKKPQPTKTRVFGLLDIFNRKINFLKERNTVDDILSLKQRQNVIDKEPVRFLNNVTPVSNNVQQKQVLFSQNKATGVTAKYNGLVFNPLNNLIRRK